MRHRDRAHIPSSRAGYCPLGGPIETLDIDAVGNFIDAMLVSAVTLAKHARAMLRRGGAITFTSGISKDRPAAGSAVVAAVAGSFTYLAESLAPRVRT